MGRGRASNVSERQAARPGVGESQSTVEAGQRRQREGPSLLVCFGRRRGPVIGDEPRNTEKDPDASEEATFEGKDEPTYRFYLLYDKIYRQDILAYAYELAKSN